MPEIKKFKLRQDENLRITQKVNHKEEEIIFKKKGERTNDQKRRKINTTEYMQMDKFVDNLEHLSCSEKKNVSTYREIQRSIG
jgi:hypothetical protein